MTGTVQSLAARKQLLLAQSRLQRMQLSLYVGDARDALRPAGLIGGAMVQPAAFFALLEPIARLLGLRRLARVVRLGTIAVVVFRIARAWRGSQSA